MSKFIIEFNIHSVQKHTSYGTSKNPVVIVYFFTFFFKKRQADAHMQVMNRIFNVSQHIANLPLYVIEDVVCSAMIC